MTNPFANNPFTDLFKNGFDFKNSFDFNQIFATQRHNIEATSAICQVFAGSAQEIARRNSEAARDSVETVLKSSKELLTSGSPESNISRQAEAARSLFESSLAHLREIGEICAKTSFEAFDVLNKRTAESMEEISKASGASAPKRKNAA